MRDWSPGAAQKKNGSAQQKKDGSAEQKKDEGCGKDAKGGKCDPCSCCRCLDPVFDPAGEGLALACKAIGFDRRQFQTIYLWTRLPQKTGQRRSILKQLLKLYDTVSVKTAQRSLTYWKRNTEYLSAVQKVRN